MGDRAHWADRFAGVAADADFGVDDVLFDQSRFGAHGMAFIFFSVCAGAGSLTALDALCVLLQLTEEGAGDDFR